MKPIKTKFCKQELLKEFPSAELGHDAQPVSPSSVVYHEPGFNVHIVAIIGFKTKMDPKIVRANLADSVLRNPRFSSLQVIDEEDNGRLNWVRTTVNTEEHIVDVNIKLENVTPEKFIEDYILNLTQTPMPKSRPLWDFHIINLKTKDAEAVAIFRVHHSLGDGSSLISLLLACTRQTANPDVLPTIPTPRNKTKKKLGAWGFLRMIYNSVVDVFMFMITTLFLKDTQTPLTSPPGVEVTPRRMVYRILSLDDMKLIKNHLNTTVNDVALGITQAGFSRYLNSKYGQILRRGSTGGLIEEQNNLPKNIRFRTAFLMNLRPAGIKAMAEMLEENSDAKYGNGAGFVLLPFNINLFDDPLEDIREAKATADRKKNSLEAVWTSKVAGLILKILGSKWESKLFHYAVGHTTGSFSNLVGPLEEVSLFGHEVAFVAAGCYGLPQGFMIHYVSYVNKMTMALSVDETTVPDPDKLLDEIEKALELAKNAVLKASK